MDMGSSREPQKKTNDWNKINKDYLPGQHDGAAPFLSRMSWVQLLRNGIQLFPPRRRLVLYIE